MNINMDMILIDTNCSIEKMKVHDQREAEIILDCWPLHSIRPVGFLKEYTIVRDYDAKAKNKPVNPIATYLYGDHVYGKVMIAKTISGSLHGLTEEDIKIVTNYLKNIRAAYFNKKTREEAIC